ncbi:hypothetical protein INT45_008136 [Circinella minor]|uniref:Uncharacterized protein n=1 Tax=Circinella minor TaxID=1195481 RepID=A0A8H7RDK9_9FUNG|nr:hypothetical protein INT45_008136 [Circinella minor]
MAPNNSQTRLLFTAHVSTTTYRPPTFSALLNRLHFNNRSRNHVIIGERGHRTRLSLHSRLPISPFLTPEKGQGPSSCTQPQTTESISTKNTLQNGILAYHHQHATTRRLPYIDRSKRCFSSHPNSSAASSSVTIPMETKTISVQSASVWPQPVTHNFHNNVETTAEMGSPPRYSIDGLYGRPLDHGQIRSESPTAYSNDITKITRTRLASEHQEISINSNAEYQSFGHEHQYEGNDDFNSRQENSNNSATSISTAIYEDYHMDEARTVYRLGSSNSIRESASTISYPSFVDPIESNSSQTDSFNHSTYATRTSMVDFPTSSLEWIPYHTAPTNNSTLYRCFNQQLWYRPEQYIPIWQMDCTRTTLPYQLFGTAYGLESLTNSQLNQQTTHTTLHGQHQCDSIHPSFWRNQIKNTQLLSHEDMEILFSTQYNTHQAICPISTQPSRLAITCHDDTKRMEITSNNVSTLESTLGSPPTRPFRFSKKSTDKTICELEPSPTGTLDQCIQQTVDSHDGSLISGPTMESDITMSTTTHSTPTLSNIDHTQLAISSLVPARHPARFRATDCHQHHNKRPRSAQ